MMRIANLFRALVLATLLATPAAAQDGERYTLEKSADGYIRMDRKTGEMSICSERSSQLVCKLAADERSAFQDEMERLQSEIDVLEKRISALESASPAAGSELPDEQTFDQALGMMERFIRHFMGIVKELEEEFGEPEPDPGTPQRT